MGLKQDSYVQTKAYIKLNTYKINISCRKEPYDVMVWWNITTFEKIGKIQIIYIYLRYSKSGWKTVSIGFELIKIKFKDIQIIQEISKSKIRTNRKTSILR